MPCKSASSGFNVNLVAIGNAPSAILNTLVTGGGTTSYDVINIVGGMQKPLVDNNLIEVVDTAQLPNWAKDKNTKAAYQLLDFMMGGWYGAKITVLRGYMTNTEAPVYAKEHPDEFPAGEAQKVADITANVRRKFAQGGTWQNRWPTQVDVYESEWARFKAA
ncbi:MAG TPA: hypothetical protein VFE63_10100 [Roseiarcus sp.]|nr:hypothetical protein [Roseiarcus sp.]